MSATASQKLSFQDVALMTRIEAAYAAGGAKACTPKALWSVPMGRHYARCRKFCDRGLLAEVPVPAGAGRMAVAFIPAGEITATAGSSLSEIFA